MLRILIWLSLLALLLWSCGPDNEQSCSGAEPAFKVVLRLMARPLPADTVMRVSYAGSGMEEFRLSAPNAQHAVTFCQVADENGAPLDGSTAEVTGATGAAGAAGATGAPGAAGAAGAATDTDQPGVVAALYCELYTAGYTELKISGSGFASRTIQLAPKDKLCTVTSNLVLDAPDAN